MFFRQVLHEDLGCASYVVADGGEAAVIDPKWEIEDYLAAGRGARLRDPRTSSRRTTTPTTSPDTGGWSTATGATIHVSAEAGVEYAHEPLADGDAVAVGERPDHRARDAGPSP